MTAEQQQKLEEEIGWYQREIGVGHVDDRVIFCSGDPKMDPKSIFTLRRGDIPEFIAKLREKAATL